MKLIQNFQKRNLVYFLVLFVVAVYTISLVTRSAPTFSYSSGSPVVLGLSVVVQDPSAILRDLSNNKDSGSTESDTVAGFLLQSSNPAAQIFLDYILVPEGVISSANAICLQEIALKRGTGDPIQLFSENNGLANLKIEGDSYVNEFQENRCVRPGKNIVPHILLGIVSVDASALYGLVDGLNASLWYPFDEQKIKVNITVTSDEFEPISPSLQILVVQPGWDGVINTGQAEGTTLHLKRPYLYPVIFFITFIFFLIVIPSINNIGKDGFFEVGFGLLLGLWGVHEILIPAYIESSILIDIFVYTLYISVFIEIIRKFRETSKEYNKEH